MRKKKKKKYEEEEKEEEEGRIYIGGVKRGARGITITNNIHTQMISKHTVGHMCTCVRP